MSACDKYSVLNIFAWISTFWGLAQAVIHIISVCHLTMIYEMNLRLFNRTLLIKILNCHGTLIVYVTWKINKFIFMDGFLICKVSFTNFLVTLEPKNNNTPNQGSYMLIEDTYWWKSARSTSRKVLYIIGIGSLLCCLGCPHLCTKFVLDLQ